MEDRTIYEIYRVSCQKSTLSPRVVETASVNSKNREISCLLHRITKYA